MFGLTFFPVGDSKISLLMYIYIYIYMELTPYVYIYIYMELTPYVYIHIYIWSSLLMYIYIYIWSSLLMYIYIYMELTPYVYIYIYIYGAHSLYIYIYIYIYIYTYIWSSLGDISRFVEDYIPGPNQYDTGTSMTWNRKTRTLKAKLETSPYRPNARDHLTCSLGSAAYKVEYHDTGKHVPRYTMGLRYDDRTILGPPNIAVEPVDTKGEYVH